MGARRGIAWAPCAAVFVLASCAATPDSATIEVCDRVFLWESDGALDAELADLLTEVETAEKLVDDPGLSTSLDSLVGAAEQQERESAALEVVQACKNLGWEPKEG